MLPTTITLSILLIFQLEMYKCQSNNTQAGIGGIDKEGAGADFKLPGLDKFNKVRLNEKNYERVRNMHANWYGAGIKAVMGKLGRDLYVKLKMDEQKKLANCLDGIEDKKDLVLAANCLINARREFERRRIWEKEDGGKWMDEKMENKISKKNEEIIYERKNEEELPKRRLKRIKLRKLRNKRAIIPSINENIGNGQRQKKMIDEKMEINEWSKRLRQFLGKSKMENSRKMEAKKMPKMKKSKWAIMERERMRPKFEIRQADDLEKLPSQEDRSAIIRVSNLISMFGGSTNSTEERVSGAKWTKMYESLVRLKRANEKRKESPGARVYEMRMYDLVLERKEPSLGPKQKMSPEGLIQMGISLLNKLRNGTDQRESNFKFMSPRFAPLMPDKQDAHKSIFSPTVFALYEPEMNESNPSAAEGNGGPKSPLNIASIPEVLRATGLNKQDRDALLQSLMEVSGSIGHVREAMDLLKALNFFEIESDLADANDRILNAYTKMERTFDLEQEREIEREGWTFLRGRQFDQLCKDQNADFPEKMRTEIEGFGALDRERRELALWKRIERIARNIPDEIGDKLDDRKHEKMIRLHLDKKTRHRRKRQTNTPGLSVLRPVILEPYMFTPVYGLSVLGPLILSPNIFSPLILAPSVLSPYVLSPAAPIPYILSPYVFGPFILSPMALAPFILTPYVLSPNVLNPFALAPLILSPTVLSPDILSPQILGGGILSPTVGSPAVLTESALMASVLSPSVLSK